MLEIIVNRNVIFVVIVCVAVFGMGSKFIAHMTLKRMVKASSNMNKSTHPLIRLIRAKFEHACMISDKVQNVGVFVDKYLYEYKVIGIKLYTWRRFEKMAIWLNLLLGGMYAGAEYAYYGMNDQVLQNAAAGAIAAILVFLVHITTDEKYQIAMTKNYMVDYLENVCAHRYEKTYQKELESMAPPEIPVPEEAQPEEIQPELQPKPPVIEEPPTILPPVINEPEPEIAMELMEEEPLEKTEVQKPISKEVLIREILEEFLA